MSLKRYVRYRYHVVGVGEENGMAIPESRLSNWSHHGPQDAAKRTHEQVRAVLDAYTWPQGMTYDFYLQGSYRNDTNVRGDSDVDIVIELKSTFHYDATSLSEFDRGALRASIPSATHSWNDFRRETLKALQSGFRWGSVAQGNKAIKLEADPPRLAADVVVCTEHRKYTSPWEYEQGITFWALQDKHQVINYPKQHHKNGAAKSARTWDRYKRTVRMYKNARSYLESNGIISASLAPSYFIESLIYNAPDSAFQHGFQDTYCSIVKWAATNSIDGLVCQNGQQYLFGLSPEQWTVRDAREFVSWLATLWNNWS